LKTQSLGLVPGKKKKKTGSVKEVADIRYPSLSENPAHARGGNL